MGTRSAAVASVVLGTLLQGCSSAEMSEKTAKDETVKRILIYYSVQRRLDSYSHSFFNDESFYPGRHLSTAADSLYQLGEFSMAGDIYKAIKYYSNAADSYIAGGDPRKAGEMFEKLKRWDSAAEMMEKAGDQKGAIELYLKDGRPYAALRIAVHEGDKESELRIMEKMPSDAAARESMESLSLNIAMEAKSSRDFSKAGLFYLRASKVADKPQYRETGIRFLLKADDPVAAFGFSERASNPLKKEVAERLFEHGDLDLALRALKEAGAERIAEAWSEIK